MLTSRQVLSTRKRKDAESSEITVQVSRAVAQCLWPPFIPRHICPVFNAMVTLCFISETTA